MNNAWTTISAAACACIGGIAIGTGVAICIIIEDVHAFIKRWEVER